MPPKPALLAAAAASSSSSRNPDPPIGDSSVSPEKQNSTDQPISVTQRALAQSLLSDNERRSASRATSVMSVQSRTGSLRSDGSVPPVDAVPKMKFRPNRPLARRTTDDVKPDPAALAAATGATPRGGPSRGAAPPRGAAPATRGAGRGAASAGGRGRGRGRAPVVQSVAAGVFGGRAAAQPQTSAAQRLKFAGGPRAQTEFQAEVYSDDEEDSTRRDIIDIDAVSYLNESAPTSLYRDRRTKEEKAAAKLEGKSAYARKKLQRRRERKAQVSRSLAPSDEFVKAEPISPERIGQALPQVRDDDVMMDEDEVQDRYEMGRRVRTVAKYGGLPVDGEDVNVAQAVDLSESESEEEEEGMEGDFVQVDGYDDPEDKLFMFQFPQLFPKFQPRTVDLSNDNDDAKPDIKPDIKPTAAQLKRTTKSRPPEEGRIGTLVVMKSGRVKMVLGDDIVMNVTPGVPTSFIQQIVHLDSQKKTTNVLGEVHRSYVVTPDIDRLLGELFINGGQTPGDKAKTQHEMDMRVKMERGLVKMERD